MFLINFFFYTRYILAYYYHQQLRTSHIFHRAFPRYTQLPTLLTDIYIAMFNWRCFKETVSKLVNFFYNLFNIIDANQQIHKKKILSSIFWEEPLWKQKIQFCHLKYGGIIHITYGRSLYLFCGFDDFLWNTCTKTPINLCSLTLFITDYQT